jgi:hypothetical protein
LECGFDPDAVPVTESPALIRRLGRLHCDWLLDVTAVGSGAAAIRMSPRKNTWSPLEYTAHVRDVYALFDRRIQAILKKPDSELELVDHNLAVAEGAYNQLDAPALAEDLMACAERLAVTLDRVRPGQWSLRGFRGGESRTIEEIAKRAVHEGRHHLMDVERMSGAWSENALPRNP